MPDKFLLKNFTSKDKTVAKQAILALIKEKDINSFSELCRNDKFIFPFLQERIITDFVKYVQKEDLDTIFEFSKIYSYDFENMIVKSWLKYANEDLTDKILELFEIGTNEQKAYCAKYFCHIQDNLSIDYLNTNAKSDYAPLKINCAHALKKFGNKDILNEMQDIVLNSNDDFKKISAYEYICAYNDDNSIKFVLENCFSSPFLENIIEYLFDYNDFKAIKNNTDEETFCRIFGVILDAYPEDISLDTVLYYQINNFIDTIYKINNQYSNNLLLLAKAKFSEFSKNDVYLFDLDKNLKQEVKNIAEKLCSMNLKHNQMQDELQLFDIKPYRYITALDIIAEYKFSEYSSLIAKQINNNILSEQLMVKAVETLKQSGDVSLIDASVARGINNENLKALLLSYL